MDQTEQTSPRVFLPGDVLPVGAWVLGPEGGPTEVRFPGTRVDPDAGQALVEVTLPDYAAVIAEHPVAAQLAEKRRRLIEVDRARSAYLYS